MKRLFKTVCVAIISLMIGTTAVSCSKNEDKFHQFINDDAAKLKLDYKDKNFLTDGIAQVDLAYAIDGDTAHFYPKGQTSGALIKTRFYGVDTPESTGKVQEWGSAASAFTKEKLQAANENGTIVISAAQEDYGVPTFDSTGTRYLALIWVNLTKKDCAISELTFLNLWLVQEGYSPTKSVSNMPSYQQIFFDAEAQAKKFELHIHSSEPDPDYPTGEYTPVTLLELRREVEKTLSDPTHENAYDQTRVIVQGTVAGFSDHILYIQGFFNSENSGDLEVAEGGEYAGINVFVGMGSVSTKFTTIGTYLEVRGLASNNKTFGFQITDTYFPQRNTGRETESKVIYTAEEAATTDYALYTHEFTSTQLTAAKTELLYCRVKITDALEVTRAYVSESSSNEITLYFDQSLGFNVFLTFVYYGDDDGIVAWDKASDFVGKSFNISGVYGYHTGATSGKTSWQIIPTSAEDLVEVK